MIPLHDVAQVRAAEEVAFRAVPEGALMQRAARALSVACARLLRDLRGGLVGSRVVLLVGVGNNGGDALWAGAMLAERGIRVDALTLGDRCHAEGAAALRRSGGLLHRWDDHDANTLIDDADLVIDGILGIGGSGALRPEAAVLAARVATAECVVVAVDVPSGVNADTGVTDGPAIVADVTVTFGAVKPGLLLSPGRAHAGVIQLVDIGLAFDDGPVARVLEDVDVAAWLPEPAEDDYKYRRGVAAIAAGSGPYPGAALLAVGGARHANVGMVRHLDRDDGTSAMVVRQFPDVVIDGSPPADQGRATAWGCGSGFPGVAVDVTTVAAVLAADVPVVIDAGGLTGVAESDDLRARIHERAARGLITVLTPHDGEFDRLWPGLLARAEGRLAAARTAAADSGAVVVLKGPGTVIAPPEGDAYVDAEGTADLATAGSGDVLTGLLAGVLAGAWAREDRDHESLVAAVAAGVWLHGCAGRIAARSGPVTAVDIMAAVPAAVRVAQFGEPV